MPDKSLINYVKSQIKKGVSLDDIRDACLQVGWESDKIREAMDYAINENAPSSPPPSHEDIIYDNTEKQPQKRQSLGSVAFLMVFLLAVGGFYLYYRYSEPIEASSEQTATPTATYSDNSETSPTPTKTPEENLNEPALYKDETNGFSFDCLKSWLISKNSTGVSVFSPERVNEKTGDFVLIRTPYTKTNLTHDLESRELALTYGDYYTKIKFLGKDAYSVEYAKDGVNILTYVLIGESDMITIRFYNAKSASELNPGQKIIYDSLQILK